MDAWFKVEIEPGERLLHLTMGGFFQPDDVTRLRTSVITALHSLNCGPNRHLTLCDISEMKIQSQDMVAQFAGLVGAPEIRSHRLAFVTGATLARVQARRLTDRPGVEFFTDAGEALAWLRAAT